MDLCTQDIKLSSIIQVFIHKTDHLVNRDKQDHQGNLESRDNLDSQDNLVSLDSLDSLDNRDCPGLQDKRDIKELLVNLDNPNNPVSLVNQDCPGLQDKLDSKELLDKQEVLGYPGKQDCLDNQGYRENQVSLASRVHREGMFLLDHQVSKDPRERYQVP